MKSHARITAALVAAMVVGIVPAHADLGDYSTWRTLRNLVDPPKPDNRVQPHQRTGDFPLLSGSSDWDDGFKPRAYNKWQAVTLDPATGARCGNGTPYTFFVNRTPATSNMMYYFEYGGACWDDSCLDKNDMFGATNQDGIPSDYMKLLPMELTIKKGSDFWPFIKLKVFNQNALAHVAISPLVMRAHPYERVKTQAWNMVYMPYCTGDIHAGAHKTTLTSPQGERQEWNFYGAVNARAATAWLKENLQRPEQLLTTGCSAGGTGATVNYHALRRDLEPTRSFLLADSGPIFSAPRGGDPEQFPSVPMYERLRTNWALDRATVNPETRSTGMLNVLSAELPAFDRNDMGSIYRGMAERWPQDRLGIISFQQDGIYSAYSYARFFADTAGKTDSRDVIAPLMRRWTADSQRLKNELAQLPNVGGYMPQYRDMFYGHCGTTLDFGHGDIQELNLQTRDFIQNVLEGTGPVMDATESSPNADFARARAGRVASGPSLWDWTLIAVGRKHITDFRDWIYSMINAQRSLPGFDPLATPRTTGTPINPPIDDPDCEAKRRCR
jgi:Pectinacetylesterase